MIAVTTENSFGKYVQKLFFLTQRVIQKDYIKAYTLRRIATRANQANAPAMGMTARTATTYTVVPVFRGPFLTTEALHVILNFAFMLRGPFLYTTVSTVHAVFYFQSSPSLSTLAHACFLLFNYLLVWSII